MTPDEAIRYEAGHNEASHNDITPIRWNRVISSGALVGVLIWPILSVIVGYLVPESMWHDPSLLEIWIEFLIGSGLLSGVLVLLFMRQRRLPHMLLTMAVSAPTSFAVLLVFAFVTHR